MERWWCKLHCSGDCYSCCLQPAAAPAVAQSGSTAPGDLAEYFSSKHWDASSDYVGNKVIWFWELSWAVCNIECLWNQQGLVCQIMKDSQFCLEIDRRFVDLTSKGINQQKFWALNKKNKKSGAERVWSTEYVEIHAVSEFFKINFFNTRLQSKLNHVFWRSLFW